MMEADNAKRELAKELLTSLYWFDKLLLGYDLYPHVHLELCEHIDNRFFERKEDVGKDNKLILMPRNSYKTSVVTIGLPIKTLCIDPDKRVLLVNEVLGNSIKYLGEITGHLETNQQLINFYGEFKGKNWTQEEIIIAQRTKKRKEPSISTAGLGINKVGMHYDLIILDDLVSFNNTGTPEQIQKVIDYYKYMLSILDPHGVMIIIGTRYHFLDLYQHLIDQERDYFSVFLRKAILDDGSLFFPEVLSKKYLAHRKAAQGSYIWSCNPKGSPMLMSDMSLKNIEDVKVGDRVVGFTNGNVNENGKLVKSKVLTIGNRVAKVVKITLESGKVIRCTPDHKWYTRRSDKTHRLYAEAKIGRPLMQVIDTDKILYLPESFKQKAYWLGGMFDGEGSCCTNNFARGSKFVRLRDKVVKIEPDGIDTVYSIQTETGNYIVWGYASKNCQYQNEPIDDENAIFHKDWIKYYREDKITDEFKSGLNRYLHVDPARSKRAEGDSTGLVVSGVDINNDVYVLEAKKFKVTEKEWLDIVLRYAKQYDVKTILLEQSVFQSTLKYLLDEEMKRTEVYYRIEKIEKTWQESKNDMIRSLQPRFELNVTEGITKGRIFISEKMTDLIDQLIRFPKGKHEDILDSLSFGVRFWKPSMIEVEEKEEEYMTLNALLSMHQKNHEGDKYYGIRRQEKVGFYAK